MQFTFETKYRFRSSEGSGKLSQVMADIEKLERLITKPRFFPLLEPRADLNETGLPEI